MCRKLIYLVSFVLVLGSVSSADTIIHWTGLGDDNLWSNPANWDVNEVPTIAYDTDEDGVYVDVPAAAAPNGPVIQDGIDANAVGLACELPGEPTMTMTGGTLEIADWIWWGDGQDCFGKFYMSGGTITVVNEFELGWGGGGGTLTMTGGTISAGRLRVPTGSGARAELWLDGGTFNVGSQGLDMTAKGQIDVNGGTLVLEGDQTAKVDGFIAAGWITACSGAGYFEQDYDERNPSRTTLTAALITEKAYKPNPRDGAKNVIVSLLQWKAGLTAASHDVYLGTNYDEVIDANSSSHTGVQYAHRDTNNLTVGPLIAATVYYWRVDEVNGPPDYTVFKGGVWRFTTMPLTAYNPSPPDGAKFIVPDANLSWSPGWGAVTHDVYFGTNPTPGPAEFKGNQPLTTYDPGTPLELEKVYYWRIDEVESGGTKYPGAVWSFTTHSRYAGGVRGQYYNDKTLTALVLTRIDPGINFNWGGGSPDPVVNTDNFSVRWIGDLEAPFSEPFTLITASDDGVRLYLDGRLIINNWTDHGRTENSSSLIELVAGRSYTIVMEYYEGGGSAVAQLYWKSPSQPKQIIPAGVLSPPLRARNPSPADGAVDVKHTPKLMWVAGERAVKHDVYFGTNPTPGSAEFRGQQTATSYVPTPLQWNTIYYWRIDEVNTVEEPRSPWKGSVWSFTTGNFVVVDDFEDYNNTSPHNIWENWIDGLGVVIPPIPGNGTGSIVDLGTGAAFVHGGAQSMQMAYDNTKQPYYSETDRTWGAQNWNDLGVKSLTVWFKGIGTNTAELLYVAVKDSAGTVKAVTHMDANAVRLDTWQEWNIPLKTFSDAGLILTSITKMYIGVGNRNSPTAGGTGFIYIDDIRLYRPRCMAKLLGDFSNDCVVDYADLDVMVDEWLNTTPKPAIATDLNGDNKVDLKDYAVFAQHWLEVGVLWP